MMSSKKTKKGVSSPSASSSSSTFSKKYEIEAEQLQYAVRKEVQEAGLLDEALKSLARSVDAEKMRRQKAETHAAQLKKEIALLQEKARSLKEKVNDEKRATKSLRGGTKKFQIDFSDEDIDDDEDDMQFHPDIGDDDVDIDTLKAEEDLECLMQELKTGFNHEAMRKPDPSMGLSRRATIILANINILPKKQSIDKEGIHAKKVLDLNKLLQAQKAPRIVGGFEPSPIFSKPLKDCLNKLSISTQSFLQEIEPLISTAIPKVLSAISSGQTTVTQHEFYSVFSNVLDVILAEKNLNEQIFLVLQQQADLEDLIASTKRNLETYYQYIVNRSESYTALRQLQPQMNPILKGLMTVSELDALLQRPLEHICAHPERWMRIVNAIDESRYEFQSSSKLLSKLQHVFSASSHLSGMNFVQQLSIQSLPQSAQVIVVQQMFGKTPDGTKINLMNKYPYTRKYRGQMKAMLWSKNAKGPDAKLEEINIILLSDVILFALNDEKTSKLCLFDFIFLDGCVLWDLPDRPGSDASLMIEIASTRSSSCKHFLSFSSEADKEKFVESVYKAIVSCPMTTDQLQHNLTSRN